MQGLSAVVADGNILRLVEKFLNAGVMENGVFKPASVGHDSRQVGGEIQRQGQGVDSSLTQHGPGGHRQAQPGDPGHRKLLRDPLLA